MFKIIVGTEEEKQQLLEASKHIHDSRYIDTELPMVNTIAHLYLAPELIEVKVHEIQSPEGEVIKYRVIKDPERKLTFDTDQKRIPSGFVLADPQYLYEVPLVPKSE